jgi:Tol biopolymer transport system component
MVVLRMGWVLLVLAAMATCATAAELGVGSLLVGKQVLVVSDTRQMTLRADGNVWEAHISPDGKYVVYTADKHSATECRLAKVSSGRTITLMSRPPDELPDDPPEASEDKWVLSDFPAIAWSPDSSLFALQATRVTWDGDKHSERAFVVVFSASGAFKCSVALPEHASIIERLLFSRDSHAILMNLVIEGAAPGGSAKVTVQFADLATGASRDVYSSNTSAPNLVGWSEDGSLLCVLYARKGAQLHKVALDGSSDQVIVENCAEATKFCPDGTLAVADGAGLTVKNHSTGKAVQLTSDENVYFQSWVPNGRMLLYAKSESIADAAKSRKRVFQSLWLSSLTPGKLDSMCVALDAEDKPSCSRDGTKIAYISQDQLYIAELALREPNADEKLAAGLPLNEQETKHILLQNGKQIAMGILMYCTDNNDALPPSDSLAQSIRGYLPKDGVFLRPGTKVNAFTYTGPRSGKLSDIQNPSDAIIGEMDGGYGWKVAIFADGHTQIEPKQ